MEEITLELLKQQCVIDADDNRFDALLMIYRDAAIEKVLTYIGWREDELIERWQRIPRPIINAVLVLAAWSFAHREGEAGTNLTDVARPVLRLLNPYVNTDRK